MSENRFEKGFQCLSGLHKGLVLLKDLPKLSMPNRTYMSENHFKNTSVISRVQRLMDSWGLVLLKDLPKPPKPIGVFMPKIQGKKGNG